METQETQETQETPGIREETPGTREQPGNPGTTREQPGKLEATREQERISSDWREQRRLADEMDQRKSQRERILTDIVDDEKLIEKLDVDLVSIDGEEKNLGVELSKATEDRTVLDQRLDRLRGQPDVGHARLISEVVLCFG